MSGDQGKDRNGTAVSRRGVLRQAGAAGTGVAAVVALGAIGTADARESPEEQVKARYQETDHVKRFYFLCSL